MNTGLMKLSLLVVIATLTGLLSYGPFGATAHLQGKDGVVHPDVLQALQEAPEVAVIISLRGPDGLPTPATIDQLLYTTPLRQASVLADLTPGDFTLTYQYSIMPALVGRLTASGATALAKHPDVLSVDPNREMFELLG